MPNAAFCTECGSPRAADDTFCTQCGHQLLPAAGTSLPAAASAESTQPVPTSSPAEPWSPPPSAPDGSTSWADPAWHGATPPDSQPVQPFAATAGSWAAPAPSRAPLPLRQLLPLAHVKDIDWRRPWVMLFLTAALAPFVLLRLAADGGDLHTAAVGFAAYFGLAWAVALYIIIRPGRLPWSLLVKVGAFTLVVGVWLAISLEEQLGADVSSWVPAVLTVGVPEEVAKALAVFLFLNLGRTHYSNRTYLFVGAFSGLVFGAVEAVHYSSLYGDILQSTSADPTIVVATLWRLLSDGLFHGAMAGITALFLGLARANRVVGTQLAVVGLALAAILHGTYDWSSSTWFGTAIAVVIVVTFLAYVRSADTIGSVLEPLRGQNGSGTTPAARAWTVPTSTPPPPGPGWAPGWHTTEPEGSGPPSPPS